MARKVQAFIPLFTLGVSTISTQVIFLRKFLDVFYGNEMIIGILLANWMLLTGIGALVSKTSLSRSNNNLISGILFLCLGILPALTVMAIVAGRVWIFPAGSTTGLVPLFIFSLLVQAPYCLLSGWLFPILTDQVKTKSDFTISESYLFESLGSFTGAIIFNILLLYYLPTFAIIYLLFLINLYQAWNIVDPVRTKKTTYYFAGVFIAFTLSLVLLSPDNTLRTMFFKGQNVTDSRESPYGNLVVTESDGQRNFYENGIPLFFSNDIISREEAVHYAMLQHHSPRKVLLVSGGISGQLEEILKYPVEKIDYLELNPWILKMGMSNGLIPRDKRIHVYQADARLWLKTSKEQYDIVLLQLTDPVTAQINRYFTYEFFRELLKNLTPDAIVSISLRSTADYVNNISGNINSMVYTSLLYSYKHVMIVPGSRNYFLASDAVLSLQIDSLQEQRKITTEYVNGAYLAGDLLSKRSQFIQSRLNEKAKLNRDFQPRVYFEETKLWLSAFKTSWWIPVGVAGLLLVLYFLKIKKSQFSLFLTGFSASSISFLLMMAFQALFGYLYLISGLIIGIFMLGLALGSAFHPWLWNKGYAPSPAWIQVYLGGFAILFLMIILGNKSLTESSDVLVLIFLSLSLVNGFMTGMQFSAVTTRSEGEKGHIASNIYSADLIGSALGMLITSALLFPLAGLIWLCLGIGLANFIAGFIMFE